VSTRRPPDRSAAKAICDALAVRYQWPEWFFARELTLEGRRIDALAARIWGGGRLGYRVLAFEVKIARGDWLRELQDLEKQRAAMAAVDQFYVVAGKEVVQATELPAGWGWLEWTGKVLRIKVHAADPGTTAGTIPRELFARLTNLLSYKERAIEGEAWERAKAEMRPALEAEIRKAFEREVREWHEKAALYDALMAELEIRPGESRYHEPAEWLRTARRVHTALNQLPSTYLLDGPAQAARRLAGDLERSAVEVQAALADLRSLTAAYQDQSQSSPPLQGTT
jgi:hypothetical protein